MAKRRRTSLDVIFDIQKLMEARLTYNKYFDTFSLSEDVKDFNGCFPPQQVNLLFNAQLSNSIVDLLCELDEITTDWEDDE